MTNGKDKVVLNSLGICAIPPDGWACSRSAGHDGPCAAYPEPLTLCRHYIMISERYWPRSCPTCDHGTCKYAIPNKEFTL